MISNWKTERIASITLSYVLCFPALAMSVNGITHMLFGLEFKLGTYAIYFSYYLLLVTLAFRTAKIVSLKNFLFAQFIAISCFLSFAFCNISEYWWTTAVDIVGNPFYNFLLFSVSGFFVLDHIEDIEQFTIELKKFSTVAVILSIIYYFVSIAYATAPGYMVFSYNLLFPTLLLFFTTLQKFSLIGLAGSLVGMCLILVAGCRGALICMIVANALYVLFLSNVSRQKRLLLFVGMGILALVIYVFWINIVEWMLSLLSEKNISSRTLEYLVSGDFLEDSGRASIQDKIIQHIGLMPKGLFADRRYANGTYAHNIVIELLIDYGIILGSFLIVGLLILSIRAFRNSKPDERVVLTALFASGLVKLFFSGSYLNVEPYLYAFLGFCLAMPKYRRPIQK